MTNATFLYDNLWDTGTLSFSSQHSNFPALNTRRKWSSESWRSLYDDDYGNFLIVAGTNDDIDFEDFGAVVRTCAVTAGTYTADSLCTEIKTQMELVTTDTFTVEFLRASLKFKITDDAGNFELLCNTGANKATAVWDTIGYDDSSDKTGADNYTADDVRIHSEEWIVNDLGSAQDVKAFIIKNHNFTNTATVKIQGHTADAWGTPDVDVTLPITADLMIYFWSSAQSKRYWRYYINDVENSDGYIETGRVFLGDYFCPESNFRRDYGTEFTDPSEVLMSDDGQITTNKKTKYRLLNLTFEYVTDTDLTSFEAMWDELGITEEFFFTRDRDNASTTSMYMRLADFAVNHIQRDELFTIAMSLEELR